MSKKLINIFTNKTQASIDAMVNIRQLLIERGYTVTNEFSTNADLIICIGGDGAFLETVHHCKFTNIPIIGVNTGHLGFFQEVPVDKVEEFIEDYARGEYTIQKLHTVKALVTNQDGNEYHHQGLNEICIKGRQSYSVHLKISIDGVEIENFVGDGILCATSAGSTAYNYSLGGSIVDPRLQLLQVTPLAPMNTVAYRSFTSSILLPPNKEILIEPNNPEEKIFVLNDGIETGYINVKNIRMKASSNTINLVRFKDYDFWSKVKSKFL